MTPSDPQSWLGTCPERFHPAIEGCASGSMPPNIAVMHLAILAFAPEEIGAALEAARSSLPSSSDSGAMGERLDSALRICRENPQAFDLVKALLESVDHAGPDLGPKQWAATYDRIAAISPEGSVALYSLGNPDLLRAATDEVVARLGEWGLLGQERRVLEVGCGIGRLLEALSPHVARVEGLDISGGMVERARQRCAGLPNVSVALASGQDLAGVADGSVDLVLASDVFPYFVQAGPRMLERQLEEIARALAPGGHLAILNFSYRDDHERDRAELEEAAARHGLGLRRVSTGDFSLWDATAFLVKKPRARA